MAFIKVESEEMKIEEYFTVKQEDTEEQTEMAFIKEEREEVTIEEDFGVKREDTEEQTEMVFIKEEREEMTIEEDFRVKREDTEEQTGWFHSQSLSSLMYACVLVYCQQRHQYCLINLSLNQTPKKITEEDPMQA